MDYIMGFAEYVGSILYLIKDFIDAVGDFFFYATQYLGYLIISLYIDFKISMIELSYGIATELFAEYEVYAFISSAFNALPSDLRYACYQFGVVDAIRIVVDAYGTAFVLRFIS